MALTAFDPSLYNPDLAPILPERRTWGTYNYASLWVAMSVCIPTYMLASGLIAGGMSWLQAVLTILLGNLIVLIPMLLNAHAGTFRFRYWYARHLEFVGRIFRQFCERWWLAGGSAYKRGSAGKRFTRCYELFGQVPQIFPAAAGSAFFCSGRST